MKKFGYQKNDDSEMLSQYLNIFTIDKKINDFLILQQLT